MGFAHRGHHFSHKAAAEHARRQDDRAQLRYCSIQFLYPRASIESSPTWHQVRGYIDQPVQRLHSRPGLQFSLIHPRHWEEMLGIDQVTLSIYDRRTELSWEMYTTRHIVSDSLMNSLRRITKSRAWWSCSVTKMIHTRNSRQMNGWNARQSERVRDVCWRWLHRHLRPFGLLFHDVVPWSSILPFILTLSLRPVLRA